MPRHFQLQPPTPPPWWLPRAWVAALAHPPALGLLVAGTGDGKTLAMHQLATRLAEHVAWITLEPDDREPDAFFALVVAAVRAQIPGFGQATLAIAHGTSPEPRRCWEAFFAELDAYNLPAFVLAIDDGQHLLDAGGKSAVLGELLPLLERLPAHTHVLVASRRKPVLAMTRALARGHVALWESRTLRFTPAEASLFTAHRPVEPGLLERLAGWPLGLELLAGRAGTSTTLDLHALVEEELYARQPPERQAFMRDAAVLEGLPPALAAEVLQADPGLWTGLADEHLIEHGRFPAYLQDFLLAEARRDEARFRMLQARVAQHHLATDDPEAAWPHALASADPALAMSAYMAAFPGLFLRGRVERLLRDLDALDALAAHPGYRKLYRGRLVAYRGDHARAKALYEEALAIFREHDHEAGELSTIVRLCSLAMLQHDPKAFTHWLMQASAREAALSDEERSALCLTRAVRAEQHGDLALVEECNMAVLRLPVGGVELASNACIAAFNMFTHALHRGHLDVARAYVERALDLSTAWQFQPYALFARFLLADLDLAEGQLDQAGGFLRTLPERWEDQLDWHDLGCALAILGSYHDALDHKKAADDALARGLATFTRATFLEGQKVVLERLARVALRRGQPARALHWIAQAGDLGTASHFDLALHVLRARAWQLDGRASTAEEAWRVLIPVIEGAGAQLLLARARLYEAATHRQLGDEPACRRAMAAFARLEVIHSYGFLRQQDAELWHQLAPPTPVVHAATPPLSALCFGSFEVHLDGVRLDRWPRRKAKLVLAALLLYRRGLSVAELADILGETGPTGQTQIQVNVSALKRILEPELGRGASRFIALTDDRYVLDLALIQRCDLPLFEAAAASCLAQREADGFAAEGEAEAALALYRGPLFDEPAALDLFEAERERYRGQAYRLALWQGEFLAGLGDFSRAEESWTRATAIMPGDPDAALALIRSLAGRGRVEKARQAYWDHRKALKARAGLMPDAGFEAAYREALEA